MNAKHFFAQDRRSMFAKGVYSVVGLADMIAIGMTISGLQTGNKEVAKDYGIHAAVLTGIMLCPPVVIACQTFSTWKASRIE